MAFTLLDDTEISGAGPVVILGPNGIGKTRLSVALAQKNNAERIGALRHIELASVPMQTFKAASAETKRILNHVMGQYWLQSQELQALMAEIIDEDRQKAVEYRDFALANP